MRGKWPKLIICLATDIVGDLPTILGAMGLITGASPIAHFLIFDLTVAAISTIILYFLFHDARVMVFNFIMQSIPVVQIGPSATVSWLYEYYLGGNKTR